MLMNANLQMQASVSENAIVNLDDEDIENVSGGIAPAVVAGYMAANFVAGFVAGYLAAR